ncbi:MAG: hypothetical protein AAB263_20075, partial [Planctomycetota bacterium]
IAADLSADHRFSVSPALVGHLHGVKTHTELIGMWDDGDDGTLGPIADLCRRVSDLAPQMSWRRWDSTRHRPAIVAFESLHGPTARPSVWVVQGERAQCIELHRGSRKTIQRDLAGAFLTLADPHPSRVHFLVGHGELRSGGGAQDGCDVLAGHLKSVGLITGITDESTAAPPPRDVIAVLGPTASLGFAMLARLDAHLRDGGGVLVLADDRAPQDLGRWLRRRGVLISGAVPSDLITKNDLGSLLRDNAEVYPPCYLVSLNNYVRGKELDLANQNLFLRDPDRINPTANLTAPLINGERQLLAPFSIACEALSPKVVAPAGTPPFTADWLLRTLGGDVWEHRRGSPSFEIPNGLAAADARMLAWSLLYTPAHDAAASGHGGRLVVWGCRQAASDAVVSQAAYANGQLLAAACRWLAGQEPPPDVPEAELRPFQVVASEGTLDFLLTLLVAIVPVLFIGGALVAWFSQRR